MLQRTFKDTYVSLNETLNSVTEDLHIRLQSAWQGIFTDLLDKTSESQV